MLASGKPCDGCIIEHERLNIVLGMLLLSQICEIIYSITISLPWMCTVESF